MSLTEKIKQKALELGYVKAGVTSAVDFSEYYDELLSREKMGCCIHGCDICQEVCPRNRKALATASYADPFLEKLSEDFDLEKILFLEDDYYEKEIMPIMYNYIRGYRYFCRNAAIAMGNSGDKCYIPVLEKAKLDADVLVSDNAKWALERLRADV